MTFTFFHLWNTYNVPEIVNMVVNKMAFSLWKSHYVGGEE